MAGKEEEPAKTNLGLPLIKIEVLQRAVHGHLCCFLLVLRLDLKLQLSLHLEQVRNLVGDPGPERELARARSLPFFSQSTADLHQRSVVVVAECNCKNPSAWGMGKSRQTLNNTYQQRNLHEKLRSLLLLLGLIPDGQISTLSEKPKLTNQSNSIFNLLLFHVGGTSS